MTFKTEFKNCKECGNPALLLPKNKGLCLKCKFPALPKEPFGVLEGCECEHCVSN